MFSRHQPPDSMIFTSRLGPHYFSLQNATKASKAQLKPIKKTGHDTPVDRMSLKQRIMGPISDDPTCSTQGNTIAQAFFFKFYY